MRLLGKAAFPAALFTALAVVVANATSIRRMSIGEIGRRADIIVVGTVAGITPRLATAPGGKTRIFTDYDLVDIATWKGSVDTRNLVVSIAGGTLHGRTLGVEGAPVLVEGRRYLLFLGAKEPLCPILGWGQGLFPLQEGPGGSLFVLNGDGLPVTSAAGGEIATGGPAMRLEEFLADLDRAGVRAAPRASREKPR